MSHGTCSYVYVSVNSVPNSVRLRFSLSPPLHSLIDELWVPTCSVKK
jgi:hypothetical protein